eukprot:CAMPEP_0180822906 /NCGR_PEP_ID=MMETSP1038_2-20121128/71611_1 /TAXON_ID=632150 /ORGANISM="Azadinium spinosum, Strain 3D9" /LENGTH=393 /DNA_ID=CAMNT_0022865181 /DNA_START=45 /DNA_END=1225 /DNA_ORIENTATION=-
MFLIIGLHLVAMLSMLDAKMIILLRHHKGDTAVFARLNARSMLAMFSSGMFMTPVFAALSDSFGRRSLMLFAPIWGLGLRIAELINPHASVVLATSALSAPLTCLMQGVSTSVVDLFPGDPKNAGVALAYVMAGAQLATVVSPLLGASLAARGVRLPMLLSASCLVTEIMIVLRFLPETLKKERQVPLASVKWSKILNPLSFLQLFSHGPRLALVAIAQFFQYLSEPRALDRITTLVQAENLGWDVVQRGRFSSLTAICGIPGYAVVGRVTNLLGCSGALGVSTCINILQNLLNAVLVKKPWQQFALLPMELGRGTSLSAMSTLTFQAGESSGISQAELCGMQHASAAQKAPRFFSGVAAVSMLSLVAQTLAQRLESAQQEPKSESDTGRRAV